MFGPREDGDVRMKSRGQEAAALLKSWQAIPTRIEGAIRGLSGSALDARGGDENWSIRETVHHLVEANLIASNILLAALAGSASPYDWSWVIPSSTWMRRLGYARAPVRPALSALEGLCGHFAVLLAACRGGFDREIRLLDSRGARPRATTVRKILEEQVDHAREHLKVVARLRAEVVQAKGRPRRRRSARRR